MNLVVLEIFTNSSSPRLFILIVFGLCVPLKASGFACVCASVACSDLFLVSPNITVLFVALDRSCCYLHYVQFIPRLGLRDNRV